MVAGIVLVNKEIVFEHFIETFNVSAEFVIPDLGSVATILIA